jgi:integrase
MSTPQKVQVFSLGVPAKGTPTPERRYRVKWRIDGRDRTRSLKTRAEAERFRRLLLDAVAAGVPFDAATGEPASWSSEAPTWFAWSQQWLELKWRQWAGTTRRSGVETLVSIAPLMVPANAPAPPAGLVEWLRSDGYLPSPDGRDDPPAWLTRWSLPLDEITPADVERVLTAITTRQDGQPVSAAVARRRKNTLGAVLRAAVRRDLIDRNPMDRIEWRAPSRDLTVDVGTVPSVTDVLRIVDHVVGRGGRAERYAALFACVGLAGMRPSEAISLRGDDLELPKSGWGRARLSGATTEPGAQYTDSGERWEAKGLKHRATGSKRDVPLPPPLVQHLRRHLELLEDPDGLLFLNAQGRPMTASNYSEVWHRARVAVWSDDDHLAAATLYDLRHAAATMMLQAGVPAAEVARRLGHSMDVLMRVYAGVVREEQDRSNELIDAELARLAAQVPGPS